jgi:hypothetical protein
MTVSNHLPERFRADFDRRTMVRAEDRLRRADVVARRRAVRSVRGWSAAAALTSVGALIGR